MADDIKVVGLATSRNKGKPNWKIIGAIIGIVVLSIGVIAGILLVRQNQDIREKAAECSQGGFACPDPSNTNVLRDCSTGETFPNDSLCNFAGRVEVCGSSSATAKQYCCPVAGGAWTTDLTKCSISTPTATATATATVKATTTATSTSSATVTATSTSKATVTATSTSKATVTSTSKTATPTTKATASGSGTPFPVPETGTDLPTMLGVSFGVVMILVSLGLAL